MKLVKLRLCPRCGRGLWNLLQLPELPPAAEYDLLMSISRRLATCERCWRDASMLANAARRQHAEHRRHASPWYGG